MLLQRVAVSIVGIPVIIALTLLGGPLFTVVAGLVLVIAALEFYSATDPAPAAGGAPTLAAPAANGSGWWARPLPLLVVLPFLPPILRGETTTGLRDWLWALGGL